MSHFAATAYHKQPRLPLDKFASETSIKVSALLLNAVKLLEEDESSPRGSLQRACWFQLESI